MVLGQKIRDERKRLNLTLEDLANKVGISKMTLHRIETGKSSPSIACLGDIAQALNKSLVTFIEEHSGFIKISRKEDQFSVESNKLIARNIFPRGSLSSESLDSMAINYVEAKSGGETETHTNRGLEWVFQISGKSQFYYDNEEYAANPGDVFFYDGRRPHSTKYKGRNRFLLISFK